MTQLTSNLIKELEHWDRASAKGTCFPSSNNCPVETLDCSECPFSGTNGNRQKFIKVLKTIELLEVDHVDVSEISKTDKSS